MPGQPQGKGRSCSRGANAIKLFPFLTNALGIIATVFVLGKSLIRVVNARSLP